MSAPGAITFSLADSFRAMKAAETARNDWWAEGLARYAAGEATKICDDAAAAQDERAQRIRDGLKRALMARCPGLTEDMVREVFA